MELLHVFLKKLEHSIVDFACTIVDQVVTHSFPEPDFYRLVVLAKLIVVGDPHAQIDRCIGGAV